jgi:hypothetical protein
MSAATDTLATFSAEQRGCREFDTMRVAVWVLGCDVAGSTKFEPGDSLSAIPQFSRRRLTEPQGPWSGWWEGKGNFHTEGLCKMDGIDSGEGSQPRA